MNDIAPTTIPSTPPVHREEAAEPRTTRAEEVSELARHRDPSQTTTPAQASAPDGTAGRVGRRVVWVRASELASLASARVAGRGIDIHAELARRSRGPVVQKVAASRRVISERARRLPPVTAFGRRGHASVGATRSGVGLR